MKVALSLFVLLAAIQSYAVMSIDTLKAKLDGRWDWVETYGGYSGETYTPQSVHYPLVLVFLKNVPQQKSDSIGYQVYRNDTLLLSGYTTLSSSAVQVQAFGPGNLISGQLVYETDTLLLETSISDGYSSTFVRSKTSLNMVRGTIGDTLTGAPIGNVKVLLAQMLGEREEIVDSLITQSNGSYSFTFSSNLSGDGFYLRTISNDYYFHSTMSFGIGIGDTITKDIKLKRIPTMVSAATYSRSMHGITVRMATSRLYLSGIEAGATIDIYNLSGCRLFRTFVPAGASEVRMPERIVTAGCCQVLIRANGRRMITMVLSR